MRAFSSITAVLALAVVAACEPAAVDGSRPVREDHRPTLSDPADARIHAGIQARLNGHNRKVLSDVRADVWEQRVMLTGTVESADIADEVVEAVRADESIRILHNALLVVPPETREEQQRSAGADDLRIEARIGERLASAKGIVAANYRWRSVLNTAYLIGRAETVAEMKTVLASVKGTDGVRAVKDFIQVKSQIKTPRP